MTKKKKKFSGRPPYKEKGAVRKNWKGRVRVAAVYPNTYHVGMSNLGFQSVYHILNAMDHIVCERVFLPFLPKGKSAFGPPVSVESGRRLSEFDLIAFSVSFESDYLNILTILDMARIPLLSAERTDFHPLVMAGGVACFLNPEPISPFMDFFLLGEGEALLPGFFGKFDPGRDKKKFLFEAARNMKGVYVPEFYKPSYNNDSTLKNFFPVSHVPEKIERVYVKDISHLETRTRILTDDTAFKGIYLMETERGCPHGCRFCSAGFVYRPPRFKDFEFLKNQIISANKITDKIGLVGTAVSDLPRIGGLCTEADKLGIRLSFSSLRADALSPELISALKKSRVKTATIAPDAGSERMRRVINKGIDENDILKAAENLISEGIPNLRLYFMVGLPTEKDEDISAIIDLCKKTKEKFLESSRAKGRIGEISVSLNPFVPKPVTPFQWAGMDDIKNLKRKIKKIKEETKPIANLKIFSDAPRQAYIQALLSRGDRKVAKFLLMARKNMGNWAKTLKESPVNPGFYVLRPRNTDELFPWDFIDHGLDKSFLLKEYEKALAQKTSKPCPMKDSCGICGVCKPAQKGKSFPS